MRLITSLALLSFSTPVLADITAQDMIDFLIDSAADEGVELTFSRQVQDGDTIVLYDFDRAFDDGASLTHFRTNQMNFKSLPDGTVELTWPSIVIIESEASLDAVETISGMLDLTDLVIIVSGTPDLLTTLAAPFDFSAEIKIENRISLGVLKFDIHANGAFYEVTDSSQDADEFVSIGNIGAQNMRFSLSINAVNGTSSTFVSGEMQDVEFLADFAEIEQLSGDTSFTTDEPSEIWFSSGPSEIDINHRDPELKIAANVIYSASRFSLLRDPETVTINANVHGWVAKIRDSSAALTEQNFALDDFKIEYIIPYITNLTPQPFRVFSAIKGLTFEEPIWAILDPNQTIPRDPINFEIDLEGDALVHMDIFHPGEIVIDGFGPFQPTRFDLKTFVFTGLGLDINGAGQIDFEINAGEPFYDLGIPSGAAHFEFSGVHTLLGKLGGMGVLDFGMVLGAKALLSIYARPTDMPDSYVSDLTFAPDGTIIINGNDVE